MHRKGQEAEIWTTRTIGLALIVIAVLSLTSAQFLIKVRLSAHGVVPFAPAEFWSHALSLTRDWAMWLGLLGLIISSVLWYAALSRLPLSVAFPFAALGYPVIFAGSLIMLREAFSWPVLAGNVLIVAGVLIVAIAS
jgi:drug/metabolite transporter (DMT)-like permease